MKADPPDQPAWDASSEARDPVWRLLARAPLSEPDAWFAARTLALCRREGRGLKSVLMAPVWMWRWTLGGGLGLSLAVGFLAMQVHTEKVDKQKDVQEAFAIMASIDPDADSSTTSSSWQDSL